MIKDFVYDEFYLLLVNDINIDRKELRELLLGLDFVEEWLFGFNVEEDKTIGHYHIYIETNKLFSLREVLKKFINASASLQFSLTVACACETTIPHIKANNVVIFSSFNV